MKPYSAILSLVTFFLLSSATGFAQTQLTDGQKNALTKLKWATSFTPKVVDISVDSIARSVIVLGEQHIKMFFDAWMGKSFIGWFPFRGIENYGADDVQYWTNQNDKNANNVIQHTYLWTEILTKGVSLLFSGSTITDSWYTGYGFSQETGVFYKTKPFGVMIPADHPAAKKDDPSIEGLTPLMTKVARAHNFVNGRKEAVIKIIDPKVAAEAAAENNPYVDLIIEYGSLSLFDGDCRNQHTCDYISEIRSRRMAANIVADLMAFPEQRQMLIIVGSAHSARVTELLKAAAGQNSSPVSH